MFEHLVSISLGRFTKRIDVLPTIQFVYQQCLGTCNAPLRLSHTVQGLGTYNAPLRLATQCKVRWQLRDKNCADWLQCAFDSAAGQCFWLLIVPPVHIGAFFNCRINWSVMQMTPPWYLLIVRKMLELLLQSLNRDRNKVSELCDLWGMKLKASRTTTMIVSRSCTIHQQSPPWTLIGTVLKESSDLDILGATFVTL